MTFQEFEDFQKNLHDRILELGNTKGKEYANSMDRFANFVRLSEQLGINRLQVATVFLQKHLDSINSFVKNGHTFSAESIQSRFHDAILYLQLMAGMVHEDATKASKEAVPPTISGATALPADKQTTP